MSLDGAAPLRPEPIPSNLKLYAGFILNITIMGRPSHFVPCCHWCLSTDVVLVTLEMAKPMVWSTKKKKRKKVHSDAVQIPFLAKLQWLSTHNVSVWQNLRSCRCQWETGICILQQMGTCLIVIVLKKKVPFNSERACLNKVHSCRVIWG